MSGSKALHGLRNILIVLLHFETQIDHAKSNRSTSMYNSLVLQIIGQFDIRNYKNDDEISPDEKLS